MFFLQFFNIPKRIQEHPNQNQHLHQIYTNKENSHIISHSYQNKPYFVKKAIQKYLIARNHNSHLEKTQELDIFKNKQTIITFYLQFPLFLFLPAIRSQKSITIQYLMKPSITINSLKPSLHEVTSLKNYSVYDAFKKHSRKSKKPLQLQSFMSELIVDNPVIYQIAQKQDLDHFEQLKKLSQKHQLDITRFNTQSSTHTNEPKIVMQAETFKSSKSKRPCSALGNSFDCSSYSRFQTKLKQHRNSFMKSMKSQDRIKNVKLRRSDILSDIQRRSAACLSKFIENNQKKQIFQYIDELLKSSQSKFKQQLSNITVKNLKLEEQKQALQREVLQMKLKIRSLQRTSQQQCTKINQIMGQNHHYQTNYRSLSKFVQDYESLHQFQQGMNCRDLIKHYNKMQELCLNKLTTEDDIKLKGAESQNKKLKDQLSSIKLSHDIVSANLKTANLQVKQLKQNKVQQNDNFQKLKRSEKQLKQLQNRIVQLFNKWYQNRETKIKDILKQMGCFQKDYSYSEMMDYMEIDLKNLSTSSKIDEFLRKVLASIQLAQRKVFPNNVSSCKMDPCKIIDDIVNYTLSLKVSCKKGIKRMSTMQNKQNLQAKYITEI